MKRPHIDLTTKAIFAFLRVVFGEHDTDVKLQKTSFRHKPPGKGESDPYDSIFGHSHAYDLHKGRRN